MSIIHLLIEEEHQAVWSTVAGFLLEDCIGAERDFMPMESCLYYRTEKLIQNQKEKQRKMNI